MRTQHWMSRNWTARFAIAAVIAVAGSTFVYAQQSGQPDRPTDARPDRPGPDRSRPERYRPTADDLSAFTDARIAAIKAGLRLTAEQEKNWPAFEEAYRNAAKLRIDRMLAFRDGPPPPPPADALERLQQRADVLGRSAAAMRQIADATTPLYKSLDEAQKRRFAVLAPMLLRQPQRFANIRRGEFSRGGQDDGGRGGMMPERVQPRGTERPRGGAMERIYFESRELERHDAGRPGIGVARENGWL